MKTAWRRLEARNLDASEIADLLGVTPRTVIRWRHQHAADDRDADIARALDAMLGAVTETPDDDERPE